MSNRLRFNTILLMLLATLLPSILNDCVEENLSSGPQLPLPVCIAMLYLFHFCNTSNLNAILEGPLTVLLSLFAIFFLYTVHI